MQTLYDSSGRAITYLRISVTDRCNYRCAYCMPAEGVTLKPHAFILRYEQIIEISRVAAGMGIRKIRLTGGEPLIKRNLEFLVAGLAAIPELDEVCMTTNGSLLTAEKAVALKKAGLHRVNISLDTLDPEQFTQITRGGCIDDVFRGIDAAVCAGLTPVKVNMVVSADTTEEQIVGMRSFCATHSAILQTINRFSLHRHAGKVEHGADRPLPCEQCNRLRLTADGYLKPCLFSDDEIKVDLTDIAGSFQRAVDTKLPYGQSCTTRHMSQIGG
jgi:GTP 3',8-cyclase